MNIEPHPYPKRAVIGCVILFVLFAGILYLLRHFDFFSSKESVNTAPLTQSTSGSKEYTTTKTASKFTVSYPSSWTVDEESYGLDFYTNDQKYSSISEVTPSSSGSTNDKLLSMLAPPDAMLAGSPEKITIHDNPALITKTTLQQNIQSSGARLAMEVGGHFYLMVITIDPTGKETYAEQKQVLLSVGQSFVQK